MFYELLISSLFILGCGTVLLCGLEYMLACGLGHAESMLWCGRSFYSHFLRWCPVVLITVGFLGVVVALILRAALIIVDAGPKS
jgi:hypothetical protein